MASLKALARVDALFWVLIYGGLLTLVLGLAVRRSASGLGSGLVCVGAVVAAVGALLIYVRSRLKESDDKK